MSRKKAFHRGVVWQAEWDHYPSGPELDEPEALISGWDELDDERWCGRGCPASATPSLRGSWMERISTKS